MQVILISLPVFLIIIAGWFFRKFRVVDEVWIHVLNLFAYYVSLPALIVVSFWYIDFLEKGALSMLLESVGTILAVIVLFFVVISLLPVSKKTKASLFLVSVTGNTVYMGFPIMASAFGPEILALGTLAAAVYLIMPILAAIFVVRWWASKDHSLGKQFKDFIKNPLVIAALIGIAISFVPKGWVGFGVLQQGLAMIGATASPVALFALGGFLYKKFLKRNVGWVVGVSAVKVILFPFLIIGAGAVGIGLFWEPVLVVIAAMPAAVTTFIIAQRFDLDQTLVCNALLVSTVLSFVTIPLFMTLLS